jgi:hypothetical protein
MNCTAEFGHGPIVPLGVHGPRAPELIRDVLDGRIKDHIVGSLTSLFDDISRPKLLDQPLAFRVPAHYGDPLSAETMSSQNGRESNRPVTHNANHRSFLDVCADRCMVAPRHDR